MDKGDGQLSCPSRQVTQVGQGQGNEKCMLRSAAIPESQKCKLKTLSEFSSSFVALVLYEDSASN